MKIANVTVFRTPKSTPSMISRSPARRWLVEPMSSIMDYIASTKPKNNVHVHKSTYGDQDD